MKTKLITAIAAAMLISLSSMGSTGAQNPTASSTTSTTSQRSRHHGRWHFDPAVVLAHMTKRFGLTTEQQDKILPILQNEAATIKSSHAQIKAILTPEQQKMLHKGKSEQTGKG